MSHGSTRMNTDKLKFRDITALILKAFYEIYNELGTGFLESVYEKALTIALQNYGLQIENQKEIPVFPRGKNIGYFKSDIIVNGKIVLELKAVNQIDKTQEAQLINYLKASSIEIGLLLNFGRKPEFERFVFSNDKSKETINNTLSA